MIKMNEWISGINVPQAFGDPNPFPSCSSSYEHYEPVTGVSISKSRRRNTRRKLQRIVQEKRMASKLTGAPVDYSEVHHEYLSLKYGPQWPEMSDPGEFIASDSSNDVLRPGLCVDIFKVKRIRNLQVVLRKMNGDCRLTKGEANDISDCLLRELNITRGPVMNDLSVEPWKCKMSGLLDPQGWFVVHCVDKMEVDALLAWTPSTLYFPIVATKATDMEWPMCVSVRIDQPSVNASIFQKKILLQNGPLLIDRWAYVNTTGKPGEWTINFLVNENGVMMLEEAQSKVKYESATLMTYKYAWGIPYKLYGQDVKF